MNRPFALFAAFAAVSGAAIVRRIRKSHVCATTADTTSTAQPGSGAPASTSHAPSDDQDEHRVIGKIDLTQFSPDRAHRRVRIGSRSILEPERREEGPIQRDTAQPVVKPTVKIDKRYGRRSPLDGKESGNWQMPRVVVSAIILYHGGGMSVWQISKATGLGARSISRVLGGGAPSPCPTSGSTALAA